MDNDQYISQYIYFFNNGDMMFEHISDIHYQCFPFIDFFVVAHHNFVD